MPVQDGPEQQPFGFALVAAVGMAVGVEQCQPGLDSGQVVGHWDKWRCRGTVAALAAIQIVRH